MDIKAFEKITAKETQELLQKQLEEFKNEVDGSKDEQYLNELEAAIDKEQEEYENIIKDANYSLSEEPLDFEGKKYSKADVSKKIIYHLNRIEQDFQYVLGLHGLILFWKNHQNTTIPYGTYDSTLRLLGTLKYKGDSEWTDILIINNYLTCAHEPYIKDQAGLIFLAEKRNAVVSRLQLIQKPQDSTESVTNE